VRRIACTLVVSAAAAAAVCADAGTATGLHGVVMRGPTTPVCRAGSPCDAPAANVTLVFSHDAADVARTTTTRLGMYRIVLRPGIYSVRALHAGKLGRALAPAQVRVVAGRMRTVDFSIDTGIR
jgi:hypothetical protein